MTAQNLHGLRAAPDGHQQRNLGHCRCAGGALHRGVYDGDAAGLERFDRHVYGHCHPVGWNDAERDGQRDVDLVRLRLLSLTSGSTFTAEADSGSATATVTATLGGISGSMAVGVTSVTLVSIGSSPAWNSNLVKGTTQQLTITANYSDSTTADVSDDATYSSSDTNVATVSADGLVTATATSGSATITVTYGGKTTTVAVSVAAPTLVSIDASPA